MKGYEQGDLLAAQALERAESHADQEWLDAARRIVWQLIREGDQFTTDDVWARLDLLDVSTHEPRALGAVVRSAARHGWIRNSGEYRKSSRPDCHSRPVPVWMPLRKADVA